MRSRRSQMNSYKLNLDLLREFLEDWVQVRESRFCRMMRINSLDDLWDDKGHTSLHYKQKFVKLYGGGEKLGERYKGIFTRISIKDACKQVTYKAGDQHYELCGSTFKWKIEDYYQQCRYRYGKAINIQKLFGAYQHRSFMMGEMLSRENLLRWAWLHGTTVDILLGLEDDLQEYCLAEYLQEQGPRDFISTGLLSKNYYPISRGIQFPRLRPFLELCHTHKLSPHYALEAYYGETVTPLDPIAPELMMGNFVSV